MKPLTAFCGINCAECPAYIATQSNDNAAREKVAKEWQKMYNPNIKASDINCDSCTSSSTKLFNHCHECKIRQCGIDKKVTNCAHCQEYACDKLTEFFNMVPNCKTTLDAIRAKK
jgi:hypothetical protein